VNIEIARARILEEFPAFDGPVLDVAPLVAEPWHNDACPVYRAYVTGGCAELWSDYAAPAERELQGPQYWVSALDVDDGFSGWTVEAETLDELRALLLLFLDHATDPDPNWPLGEIVVCAVEKALAERAVS
jgi:hypothetical protein